VSSHLIEPDILTANSVKLNQQSESLAIVGLAQMSDFFSLTLSPAFNHSSIVSRFNGTSTECGSSFRCNNQWQSQGFYPQNECATVTPHHHLHYPPQYNQQFGASNGGNSIHFNCRSTVPPPHGRLQKSLSFAFQTPAMMNEMCQPSHPNQSNSVNYPERSYSR
jgi:hypothetical protein